MGGGWASQRREQTYGPSLPKASEASGRRPDHALSFEHGSGADPPPPPSLRAPLLGYSWLLKVLLSAHIMILIGAALHDYLKHLNQAN